MSLPLPPYASQAEIERLVAAFEDCTLARAEWTHRAHLTVGAWYLSRCPLPEAVERIRAGILKLNRAQGTVNDADHGYHETITLFYAGAIAHHWQAARGQRFLDAVNGLLARRGYKEWPLEYYSRERLMSRAARAAWVEPDLKPFEWVGLAAAIPKASRVEAS